jgi:deoxyguanosinetriphosphate triphosphohydrolase, putative
MTHPLELQPDGMIPAAARTAQTQGRRYAEREHRYRNPYQRDRDRIIHAGAFRRLEYKTQVFVNGEGDHYRTRLTHTLEVTQIARTIARALGLNEDLAEAVALSHDMGHTPFGHAGERVLRELMHDDGGFDHNVQGLRVVDVLEKRYAAFDGLNLDYEVREAFIRHGGAEVAQTQNEFDPWDGPLLEVAATMAADDIAYMAHDIDDGLYAGILKPEDLHKQELWRQAADIVGFDSFAPALKRAEGVRSLINLLVTDLVEQTRHRLVALNLDSTQSVRKYPDVVVTFSGKIEQERCALKDYLFGHFYRHKHVTDRIKEAERCVGRLFTRYMTGDLALPSEYQAIADTWGKKRAVADYIAGMTDRFAWEMNK